MLNKILNFTITQKEKAVYAFIVGSISAYMVQNGLSWKQVLTVAGLKALFAGVISHQFVYWVQNSTSPRGADTTVAPIDTPQ